MKPVSFGFFFAFNRIFTFIHSENSPPLFKAGIRTSSSYNVIGQAKLENVSATSVKMGESNELRNSFLFGFEKAGE